MVAYTFGSFAEVQINCPCFVKFYVDEGFCFWLNKVTKPEVCDARMMIEVPLLVTKKNPQLLACAPPANSY